MSQTGEGAGADPREPLPDAAYGEVSREHHHEAPEPFLDEHDEDRGHREPPEEPQEEERRGPRRGRRWVPVVIALLVLLGGGWFAGSWAFDELSSRLAPPPDYAGPGSGSVLYEVKLGASSTQIARELKQAKVVKSVDAFRDAARENDESRNIQVGYYRIKKQMSAAAALDVLVDPENLISSLVVVPEGARVDQIVTTIVDRTDIRREDVAAALADPTAIGLPTAARGNPEGYLFPATYNVGPKQTAAGLIRQMVAKTVAVERSLDIGPAAKKLGYSSEQVLTVASILEYEANRSQDYPKVARVLYNRLDEGMKLQLDSTVTYISKRTGDVFTTPAERANPSLYNTYVHKGLPPGPIGSPGEKTIKAALTPADGSWLFFVPDYENNTTVFSTTLADHNKAVKRLQEYCRGSEDC